MTGEQSSELNDAQEKCRNMSAKLPIIKSESENSFILRVGESLGVAWYEKER